MFKVANEQAVNNAAQQTEANYTIQKNDLIQLQVYTNLGEKIIDPGLQTLQSSGPQAANETEPRSFLVDNNGVVKFPLLSEFKIEGLTLRAAEELLQKEYAKYYKEPFVVLSYSNKRVVVLGAMGGQVIPLANENMRLTEILALAKGIGNDGKANNIRVLRGQEVFVTDLSTIEAYRKNNILMQPNDIIYIEPVRRPISEALRDYGPVISVVSSITTLLVVIFSLK